MENLLKIQAELKVPKTNVNAFGKYKYRSCEDILEAVKPLLKKYECTLTLTDEIVAIGNKLFLKATAKLNLTAYKIVDEASTYHAIQTFGFAELAEHKGMSAEQATGTASSYARKYALNGLFLIDETESDADSIAPNTPNTPIKESPVNVEQWKKELDKATNLEQLGNTWKAFADRVKENEILKQYCKELSLKLK